MAFTDPEIATFGLSEKQLKQKSIRYKKLKETHKLSAKTVTKQEIINAVSAAYDSAISVHIYLKPVQIDEMVQFFAGPKSPR